MDPSRAPLSLHFGLFSFDEADARLLSDGCPVSLTPKAFDVLTELLRNAGVLVTKDALLDAVWGHRHVSESLLKTTISELRAALGDDAKSPRWIETATRRGYRFIGVVDTEVASKGRITVLPASLGAASDDPLPRGLIGRDASVDRLQQSWIRAAEGRRQFCFVAGEAGIGKTTLIDAFVSRLGDVALARGQCVEQSGEGEPYLPVLDALADLVRADSSVVELLRRVAPTWLLQMPWLVERPELERLHAGLAAATQDRMLREFSELAEQLTAARPLVLVTEDLHWCDGATVRLIEHVARRRSPARFLWLATYRTPELVANAHPLNGLRHELRARQLCEEVLLEPFSEAELAAYLLHHRPALALDEAQVRRLHRRTDGLPLFVANAVDNVISPPHEEGSTEDWDVPESLLGVIERQRARLASDTLSLLEAAAVCGVEFECSVVAGMLQREAVDVAKQCDELARHQTWLAFAGLGTLDDGTLDPRFVFRHALYRQAFYQRIALPQRAALHRGAAAVIERLKGGPTETTATLRALHYERGMDALGAMRAYAGAGVRALRRFAPREALLLAARGLAQLEQSPHGEERLDAEMGLQHLRSTALAQSTGVSNPDARTAYHRCVELWELLPPTQARAWVVVGLVWMFNASGEYTKAAEMALRLRMAADSFDDGMLSAAAAISQAVPMMQRGRLEEAALLLDEAHARTQSLGYPWAAPTVVHDPSTMALSIGAVLHATRGQMETAQRWSQQAMARAEQMGQPLALVYVARCANLVDIFLDRPDAVLVRAKRALDLARVHQMPQAVGVNQAMYGWASALTGGEEDGLRQAEEGCAAHAATGSWFEASCLRRLAAEAALAAGNLAAAHRHLDEGFSVAARIGEALHLPFLWSTRATLAAREGDMDGARAAAKTAASMARESGALTAELTARLALCEFAGAGTDDFRSLRELRARWQDPFVWATLERVDALLAGNPQA